MGQKSLSVLHRIDNSMIWDVNMYNKNYKWLSYNLWFAYINFYKVIFFLEQNQFYFFNNLTYFQNSFITNRYQIFYTLIKNYKRFSYYIDLYCITFIDVIILINVYFETTLLFYKQKKKYIKKKISNPNFFLL